MPPRQINGKTSQGNDEVRLLTLYRENSKKFYFNADIRGCNADSRGFTDDNLRKSACNPRESALKIVFQKFYKRLYKHFGPQHWWPGETPFEVIIGAILTQNTAWTNVEKAIRNLKDKGLLSPEGLKSITKKRLAGLIRPAGYFNIKAKRIKEFVEFFFSRYNGSLNLMRKNSLHPLRNELLGVNGIGPETADSILLYALDKPIFMIDAYTKRILYRHGIIDEGAGYDQIQSLFMKNLPRSTRLFNEYHALFVRLGKEYCTKKEPRCKECPLGA